MNGTLRVEIGELSINLADLYDRYRYNPADLDDLVDLSVASTRELLARGPDGPPRHEDIMPMMVTRHWLEAWREENPNKDQVLVFEEFDEEIIVMYVEDHVVSTPAITEAGLRNANLDRDELRALALENLRKTVPELEIEEGDDPVRILGDTFTTSLILLDDFWAPWEAKMDGELVVSIPSRHFVFFCGANDMTRLQRLRDIAREQQAHRYNITEKLFVRRAGRFIRFDG